MTVPLRWRLLSLGLLSGAGLLLEIALTRVLSTLFYPPYAFAVLSLAILGIGLGAGAAAWRPRLRDKPLLAPYMALAGVSTATVAVAAAATRSSALQVPLLVLVALPYVAVGLALATLFASAAQSSPRLYLADLAGAGAGTVAAIPILNALGGLDSVLLAGAAFAAAGLTLRPRHTVTAVLAALASVAFIANLAGGWLVLDMRALPTEKPIVDSLVGGQLLATEWDAFARTDLVDPGDGSPYRLYMDGAAGSVMPPAGDSTFLRRDIGFLPFAAAQLQRVFVIGPGGGLDVRQALEGGASEVVAVEVNPGSVALVREFADYHGGLYADPAVRVVIDEGRSVLRRENSRYDLILLSQVVTLAAERSGYALTENTIYTVEAFADYLDHVTSTGLVAIKLYDEATLTRALSTALATLRERGQSDAEAIQHTAAFLDPRPEPPVPLLLVRAASFAPDEALELGLTARELGFEPLFLPGVVAQPPLDQVQAGNLTFSDIVARSEIDISPTTDDRPFFYQFEHGVPASLKPLVWIMATVLAVSAAVVAYSQQPVYPAAIRWAPAYFGALGFGFITLEIGIIQQVRLFLGHPTLAVTTALAVLLIGGGIGSEIAGRRLKHATNLLPVGPALAVAALALIWILVWPVLSGEFHSAVPAIRVAVVAITLLPLALVMGTPFPLALRAVGLARQARWGDRHVALAWAVNGVTTVAGSVAAITVAIVAGFSRVLAVGLVTYVLAAAVVQLTTARQFHAAPAGAPDDLLPADREPYGSEGGGRR